MKKLKSLAQSYQASKDPTQIWGIPSPGRLPQYHAEYKYRVLRTQR